MDNKRRLIRLDVEDFLEIKPLNEVGRVYREKTRNFTIMGICFSSQAEWSRGQTLSIDYFISEEAESVRLKVVVVWSEFIGTDKGYFCGCEIIDIEEAKKDKFTNYYLKKLREKFS
ncbi:MAG: hypothetical protein GF375_03880 [Candidatus Omnitrophica bacterium]|nr:hypothetical protein [Candidatus Omnitrophota bacterium]MBD3269197.1 hypothetical protein [Candidatus Omnitrophota bacterium]